MFEFVGVGWAGECENSSTGVLKMSIVCYYNKKILYLCELLWRAVNGSVKGLVAAVYSWILRESVFSGGIWAIYIYI